MSGTNGPRICFESSEGLPDDAIDETGWLMPADDRADTAGEDGKHLIDVEWPEPRIPADWGSPKRRRQGKPA